MDDSDGGTATQLLRARAAALRAVASETGSAPGAAAFEEALRAFGNERALLLAVHQRWQVTLLARLDQVLEEGTGPPHDDVLAAVQALSRDMPGFAALLRDHTDDPVLAAGRRRLADYVARACPCGRPHPLVAPTAPAVGLRRELTGLATAIRLGVGRCRLRCAARRQSPHRGLAPGRT
jgi:hypothetical protein